MKLSLRKSFRAIMKGCLTLASAFVIISVNSTCMGPGYQPRIPDTANTQITFAFFFSFTIHLSVLALQITVELVSKNFFANL